MEKGTVVSEGKGKTLYRTSDPNFYIMSFNGDMGMNGEKSVKDEGWDKSICSAKISASLFSLLNEIGLTSHYIESINERELLVRKMEMLPIIFMARNVIYQGLARRLGMDEGLQLLEPVLEFYYKNKELGVPLVNEYHLRILGLLDEARLRVCAILSQQINIVLKNFFARRGLLLVDCQLEFGMIGEDILLGDELTLRTCRLWDARTGERFDEEHWEKDRGVQCHQRILSRVLEKK